MKDKKEKLTIRLTESEYYRLLKESNNYKLVKEYVKNKDEHIEVINFINFIEKEETNDR